MNRLRLTNSGNVAEKVSVVLEPGFDSFGDWNAGTMNTDGASEAELEFVPTSKDLLGTCTVTYSALDGKKRKAFFTYVIPASERWIQLERVN